MKRLLQSGNSVVISTVASSKYCASRVLLIALVIMTHLALLMPTVVMADAAGEPISPVRGEIVSCPAWTLNKHPELRKFLKEGEAEEYEGIKINWVDGKIDEWMNVWLCSMLTILPFVCFWGLVAFPSSLFLAMLSGTKVRKRRWRSSQSQDAKILLLPQVLAKMSK